MMYATSMSAKIEIDALDRTELEILFHALGAELMNRQGSGQALLDHAVSIDLGKSIIEIDVFTSGESIEEANAAADRTIIDVLKATGGDVEDEGAPALIAGFEGPLANSHILRDAGFTVTERESVLI